VPALSIALGTDYVGRATDWGLAQQQAYTRERYHKPTDVYAPSWDLAGMQQQLELMYLTGANLANADTWPEWRAGSPFRAIRLKARPAAP
jgi:hypothetical protein